MGESKKNCEDMLQLTDKCPECRKNSMEVGCETNLGDGSDYYFLNCGYCDFQFDVDDDE